jgi:hypothetical protein
MPCICTECDRPLEDCDMTVCTNCLLGIKDEEDEDE